MTKYVRNFPNVLYRSYLALQSVGQLQGLLHPFWGTFANQFAH